MKLYKIKKSNIDNKGLYASQDIKDRSKIIEYKGKIITKWDNKENFIVPKETDEDDITGTLQMKYAVELGGTIIHTVGFDCLKNRIEKDETWEWTLPTPWDMNKQQQRQWDQALMDTWKLKMKTIEHKHLNIQWRHFL